MSFNTRIGTEIAGYRLERQLGQGAFAAVYVAEHIRLGNKVAMKVLDPTLARDEGMCSRFIQESRIAAELDHPGIIPILNAGEQDGLLFIVMKYVQGRDLYTLIREQGTLSATRASSIIDQIAGGLDAAHSRGLVHRDIKPQNILIEDNTERAYVIDFGIVKRVTSAPGLEAAAAYTSIGFKGTAHYAPPEQINGLECDARTDVYALGGVVYECLTGQAPYGHLNYHLALQAQIEEPPPSVVAARPELPYTLDTVVTTAMAKRPDDRYSSCGELASALRAAAHGRHAVSTQVVAPEPAGSGYLEYPGALTVPPIAAVPGPAEVPASQVSPPPAPPSEFPAAPQVPASQYSPPPVPESVYGASEPPPPAPPPSVGAGAMGSAPPSVTPGHPGGAPPPSTGGGGGGGWDGGTDGGSGRRGSGGGGKQGGGLSDAPRWLLWVAGLGIVAILALAMVGAYELGKGDDKTASGGPVTTHEMTAPDTTGTTTETTETTERGLPPADADPDEVSLWNAIPKEIRTKACNLAEPEHAGGLATINCDYTDPNHGRTLIHLDRFVDRSHLESIYAVHGLGEVKAHGGNPDPKRKKDTGKCNGVSWLGEGSWRHEASSSTAPVAGKTSCYQADGQCDLVAKMKLTGIDGPTCSVVVWTNFDGNLFVKAEQQTDNHSKIFGFVHFWQHRFG